MTAHTAPNPMHELQDQYGAWQLFEGIFDGYNRLPLPPPITVWGFEIYFSKFMLLELLAALIIVGIYVPLAQKIRTGGLPTGWWWNLFEVLFLFIRDQIARPNLDDPHAGHDHDDGHGHDAHKEHAHAQTHGHAHDAPLLPPHAADQFVPFLATMFLFILFCNLLGMVPFLGSPTASIWVTAGMAVISFLALHLPGLIKRGPLGYFASLWPRIEIVPPLTAEEKKSPAKVALWVPGFVFGVVLSGGIFFIEMFGTVIKAGVLAVRLFANMFAGHMVLATILGFIYFVGVAAGVGVLWGGVTLASVVGVVALSLLELFVAFLQAYIFTFLTALFMGMSLYPEH
jgi:F-type H+-transporting ATPase subunit a